MVEEDSSGSDSECVDDDGGMFPQLGGISNGNHYEEENDSDVCGQEEKIGIGKKRRKLRKENEKKKLHKPPTVEELNRLRETENLFHSNLFRRQIEEMLTELEIKDKYKVRVSSWLDKFNDWLFKVEDEDDRFNLSDSEWLKHLRIPLPSLKDIKGSYQFKKPVKKAFIIGSFASKCFIGPGNIDIAVEIPSSFFQKDDSLNGRYHVKRALYLSHLAKHFQVMDELVREVRYVCDEGDNLKPLIEIVPSGKLNKNTTFTVHLIADKSTFKLSRFMPSKNNVRSSWLFGIEPIESENVQATPKYNSSIIRDLTMPENEEYIADLMKKSNQLRDAVVLFKVWVRQRELHLGHGSFNGFFITMIVGYLLHIRKLNTTMSSYQIVRTMWNFLKSSDWTRNGPTLCDIPSSEQQPAMSEFHEHFPLVFLDPSGFLNLCDGMTSSTYFRCRDEAEIAMEYLDEANINSFQILFMIPAPFSMLCDHYIHLYNWRKIEEISENHSNSTEKLNSLGTFYSQARDTIYHVLSKGLGQRVRRLFVKEAPRKQWPIEKKPPRSCSMTFGLILDPDHCFSLVDKGPVGDAKEAEDFKEFWKGLSELRRFKDGSITEAVVWSASSWEEKRMICRQVVDYLLKSTFQLENCDFRYIADELQTVLNKESDVLSAKALTAYEKLVKVLKNLPDLPLDVISVQGISPIFRHSELFPPTLPSNSMTAGVDNRLGEQKLIHSEKIDLSSSKIPQWCAPAEVLVQLGSSNKWPNDLEAIRRIRAAFNIKVAQLLRSAEKFVTQPYQDYIDVLTKTCVFRLRIVYPGEIVLKKKSSTSDGLIQYLDTKESLELEGSYVHLPKVTSALHGLHNQYSSFGPACCITKRWIRSHLFDESHISDVAIDLLMAAVYLNPEPWRQPNQPQLAFLRFLYLIGHTNWNLDFVLLNFNAELKKDEINSIRSYFDNHRATLPALFIATPYDKERSIWTKDGPTAVVTLRLISLCQRLLTLLNTELTSKTTLNVQSLFKPSLYAFDVIIKLTEKFVLKRKDGGKAWNTDRTEPDTIPVVGFDPTQYYLKELRESFGEWALFFYDSCGGSVIGVLWKPSLKEVRDIKVSHMYGRHLENDQLKVNVEAFLQSFCAIGDHLVKSVEVREGEQWVPFNK